MATSAGLSGWDDGSGITDFERESRRARRATFERALDKLLQMPLPSITLRDWFSDGQERWREIESTARYLQHKIDDIAAERFFSAEAVERIDDALTPASAEEHPQILGDLWQALAFFHQLLDYENDPETVRRLGIARRPGRPRSTLPLLVFASQVFSALESARVATLVVAARVVRTLLEMTGQPCPKDLKRYMRQAKSLSHRERGRQEVQKLPATS